MSDNIDIKNIIETLVEFDDIKSNEKEENKRSKQKTTSSLFEALSQKKDVDEQTVSGDIAKVVKPLGNKKKPKMVTREKVTYESADLTKLEEKVDMALNMASNANAKAASGAAFSSSGGGDAGGGIGKQEVLGLIGASSGDPINAVSFNDTTNVLTITKTSGGTVTTTIDNDGLNVVSGAVAGTDLTLTMSDASTVVIDVTSLISTEDQSVVANIAARDALTATTGDIAYTIDATADATVDSGAAMYVYDSSTWQKIAEFESLDLNLNNAVSAVVDPAATDDSASNYAVGQIWVNTATNQSFIANSVSVGAAVWERIDQAKVNSTTSDPIATDDSAAGYEVGSVWVNITSDKAFMAVDVTATAAVWAELNPDTIKNNFAATSNPATTNDNTEGYEVGSNWINVTKDTVWTLSDSSTGAAVWDRIDSPKFANITSVPAATNDSTEGYEPGSRWIDVSTGKVYFATDVSAGAAVWQLINPDPNDRAHADDTTVNPTTAGEPTLGEIEAFASGATVPVVDTIVYYTGDDTPANTPTHVYHVDNAGTATLLLEPVAKTKHVEAFNATTDWGTAAGGLYTITVASATHGITTPNIVQVWQINGLNKTLVTAEVSVVISSGDVSITTNEVPDARFVGELVIA